MHDLNTFSMLQLAYMSLKPLKSLIFYSVYLIVIFGEIRSSVFQRFFILNIIDSIGVPSVFI